MLRRWAISSLLLLLPRRFLPSSSSFFLLSAASSEVQNELSDLGVSVYAQEEFEEGVLRQIDQEFTRRNIEQERKFLVKEYSSVKRDIK